MGDSAARQVSERDEMPTEAFASVGVALRGLVRALKFAPVSPERLFLMQKPRV